MQYRVYAIKYITLYVPTSLENFEKKNRVLLFAFLSFSNSTIKGKRKMQKGYEYDGSELDTTEKLLQNTHRGQSGILRAKVATM